MIDAAILSNRIITPNGVKKAVVLIEQGKIAAITNELPQGNFPIEDIGDNVLMAGIVDPHVHINEPGRTDWEGFDTATKAALAGGITSLVEMPLNASPVTTTGSFSLNMTGLTSGTAYYVRAYATNTKGTSYGATKSFTTTGTTPISYCTSLGSNYSYEWISSVAIGTS